MLSRSSAPPRLWDIFCAVIDNHGDIGVCWRLARQLAGEHGLRVRLWVDDLEAFRPLCPRIDPTAPRQTVADIEIHAWGPVFPAVPPGDVVIEAFGCRIPDSFVVAMAGRAPAPAWINLEYLSAEAWVAGCHALPSPHPRLPLRKYFFFPGFSPATGGLLRERDLFSRRNAFQGDPAARAAFWHALGFPPPPGDALCLSLFTYETPAIGELLGVLAGGTRSVCCAVPAARALSSVAAFCGETLTPGQCVRRGALEIRVLPFVEQTRYDPLLWGCDLNLVRGEDSFVRAQWAARPLLWHIYAQDADAHLVKLDAFLDRYCASLPEAPAAVLRAFWHDWNAGHISPGRWHALVDALPVLRRHASTWAETLAKQDDLAANLVNFCSSGV